MAGHRALPAISIERIGLVMNWVIERDKQEKALREKLDAIARRMAKAEKDDIETRRVIERLARACVREPRQQREAPALPKDWTFPAPR